MRILLFLRERDPRFGNKGTFGKVFWQWQEARECAVPLICAVRAAFQTGAGMVRIRTAEENQDSSSDPASGGHVLPMRTEILLSMKEDFDWCDVLVIGPGAGHRSRGGSQSWLFSGNGFRETEKPVVLDADGLNLLRQNPTLLESVGRKC